jgi:predicted nucleotidyltransferase
MGQVGHADSKMTMDVYAQLEQRVERSHGTNFDRLLRSAREQSNGDGLDADIDERREDEAFRDRLRRMIEDDRSIGALIEASLIREAARRLAASATKQITVVLFGSYARVEADSRSDLDLLVIEPKIEDRNAEYVRLRRGLRGLGVAVDLVLVSQEEVARWRDVPGTLIREALHEGRVLVDDAPPLG